MFFPIPSSWHKLLLVTVVLGVPGVNGLNPCLDAEDAVNYKCARGTGSMIFGRECGYLVGADLPELQECFDAAGRTGITIIDLHWTTVPEFPEGMFNNLPNLRALTLGSSVAQTIPVGLFDDLKASLTILRVVDCPELAYLTPDLFAKLSNLQQLSLGKNPKLDTLPVGLFKGNRKLTSLSLCGSGLTALPLETFNGLLNLQTLYLTRNSLTTLPADIFGPLASLSSLYLHGDNMASLQCLPESTAGRIVVADESTRTGTCQCGALSSCPEGTTCSPGTAGFTCGLPC